MSNPRQADARALTARRKLRQQRRQRAKAMRLFEVLAAIIPGWVGLLMLTLKSSGVSPEDSTTGRSLFLPGDWSLAASQQFTAVPEPNVAVLFGLGVGALLYLRRKTITGCHRHQTPAGPYPSRMATAVA